MDWRPENALTKRACKGDSVLYHLMNKDVVTATYRGYERIGEFRFSLLDQCDSYLPYGLTDPNSWIDFRQIAKHRRPIEAHMRAAKLINRQNFVEQTHCLALTDTFWMKRADEDISWDEVSLYHNPFDDVIARIAFDGTSMCGGQNSLASPEYATSGSFAKCWVRDGDEISLLKRGSSGWANAGFEPYSEVLAAELLDVAGVDHVPYTIEQYHGKLASKCPLFTSEDVGFVSAHRFFDGPFDVEDVLAFCDQHGGQEPFREMIVMDAVMANVDRHAGNYGFLIDNATGEVLRMAPLFDQNMACLPMMMEHDDFDEYVGMIGPKIGTDFVMAARALITSDIRTKLVALKDFEYTDPGLGCPAWKLDAVNRLKDRMIANILV